MRFVLRSLGTLQTKMGGILAERGRGKKRKKGEKKGGIPKHPSDSFFCDSPKTINRLKIN